jgi:probable phosphoglycerate mutase
MSQRRIPAVTDVRAEVVLVRHGETAWSLSGQHTGRTDIPLTEAGRRQASKLGDRLRDRQFAAVLTSPLQRAAETCRLAGFGELAETTEDLLEWDYGDYEGVRTDEIRRDVPGWSLWSDGARGGETADDVGRRADRVIRRLRTLGGDAVVFAHGHVLRVLTARWLGLAPSQGRHFALDPATLSALGHEREVAVIRTWNSECG